MEKIEIVPPQTEKKKYINYLKFLAILAVIVIHVLGDKYYSALPQGVLWYFILFGASLVRFAVPIFIMCSGAINLNENKDFSIKKSFNLIIKYIVIFLIWNFLYLNLEYLLFHTDSAYTTYMLQSAGIYKYHLWYLLSLLFLYFITPALKLITKKENKHIVEYLLIIFISSCLILSLSNIFYKSEIFKVIRVIIPGEIFAYIFLYILGWYLSTIEMSPKLQKLIIIGGIIAYILSPFLNISLSILRAEKIFITSSYFDFFNVLSCCALFLIFKNSESKLKQCKVVDVVAKNTLYIYLSHVAIIMLLQKYFFKDFYIHYRSIPIYIAETIFVFFVSLLISLTINHTKKQVRKFYGKKNCK